MLQMDKWFTEFPTAEKTTRKVTTWQSQALLAIDAAADKLKKEVLDQPDIGYTSVKARTTIRLIKDCGNGSVLDTFLSSEIKSEDPNG